MTLASYRSKQALPPWLAVALRIGAINALAAVAGLIVLIALFKLGVAGGMGILFYRGLVLCVLAGVLTAVLLSWLGHRTGLASLAEVLPAIGLSLGLNIAVLVLFPVTVDRSISVFMLGYMAANAGQSLTAEDMERAFEQVYVRDLKQVPRRLREQEASGNIIHADGRYRLSPQGEGFIRFARTIGWLFDTDPQFVTQAPRRSAVP